jgi:hypothetical protein
MPSSSCEAFFILYESDRLQLNVPGDKSTIALLLFDLPNRFYPDCLKRSIENDEFSKIKSRVFKGRTGRNANHSISGISERKGDIITSVARSRCGGSHYNKKQYRINDFFSTCLNSLNCKGLVIGVITLTP